MQPLLFDGGGQIFHLGGGGAGAAAVRKGVDARKGGALGERAGGGEVLLRLAGEAGDDVGGDGGAREIRAREGDAGEELLARVVAVHAAQDGVRPALQREVEVGREVAHLLCRFEQPLGDDARLERAEADARGRILDGEQQVGEISPPVVIRRDVDAGDDDLFCGRGQDLRRGALERARAGAAAQIRDDAVGAEVVAAVLDLDEGTALYRLRGGQLAVGGLAADAHAARVRGEQVDELPLALRARDEKHPLLFGKGGGGALGGAAAHGDAGVRRHGADARDRLARLFFRLRRDGAGVEDEEVGVLQRLGHLPPSLAQGVRERGALAVVDLAAQGEDDGLHRNSPRQ